MGGISRVIRHKEERGELIDEIRRLREKVTTLERERATLQTQVSLKQININLSNKIKNPLPYMQYMYMCIHHGLCCFHSSTNSDIHFES